MSKHTPGPWMGAPRKGKYRAIPANDLERSELEKIGHTEFEALSIGSRQGQVAIIPLDESNEANALLIAAAPELLNALEHAVRIAEAEQPGTWDDLLQYRALLRKATGKEAA